MHPILTRGGSLGLYLLSWLPLVPLAALLLAGAGVGWGEALAEALPLVLVYAYLCLASWYICRAVPLRPVRPWRLAAAHGLGAVLSSALWVLLGWGWAGVLDELPAFQGAGERYLAASPRLYALGVPLYLLSAAVHYLLLALESARDAERRALELRVQAREAELRALKAQIDPHFLFNSLNAASALVGSDPAGARRMVLLLAELLRRSLRLGRMESIPLGEELAHAAAYLAVERVRFGDRLDVQEDVAEASRTCLVPALILQPLVENAVRHGIAQLLEGGAIRIEARRSGSLLRLAVENPCDPDHPPARGEGIGLSNVAARLRTLHGREARLTIAPNPGRFRVELELPAVEAPREETPRDAD